MLRWRQTSFPASFFHLSSVPAMSVAVFMLPIPNSHNSSSPRQFPITSTDCLNSSQIPDQHYIMELNICPASFLRSSANVRLSHNQVLNFPFYFSSCSAWWFNGRADERKEEVLINCDCAGWAAIGLVQIFETNSNALNGWDLLNLLMDVSWVLLVAVDVDWECEQLRLWLWSRLIWLAVERGWPILGKLLRIYGIFFKILAHFQNFWPNFQKILQSFGEFEIFEDFCQLLRIFDKIFDSFTEF